MHSVSPHPLTLRPPCRVGCACTSAVDPWGPWQAGSSGPAAASVCRQSAGGQGAPTRCCSGLLGGAGCGRQLGTAVRWAGGGGKAAAVFGSLQDDGRNAKKAATTASAWIVACKCLGVLPVVREPGWGAGRANGWRTKALATAPCYVDLWFLSSPRIYLCSAAGRLLGACLTHAPPECTLLQARSCQQLPAWGSAPQTRPSWFWHTCCAQQPRT